MFCVITITRLCRNGAPWRLLLQETLHLAQRSFTGHYQNVSILDFIGAKDDGGGGTTGAIRHAKFQSNCHHQQTNTQLFTGRVSFLASNQSTEGTLHIDWVLIIATFWLFCLTYNISIIFISVVDLVVQAKSGTGKTCVFAVIALENVDVTCSSTQVSGDVLIFCLIFDWVLWLRDCLTL